MSHSAFLPVPPETAGGGLSARFLARLLRRIAVGRIDVRLPGGAHVAHTAPLPGPSAALELQHWRALRRVLTGGDIGFADGYIDGDWSTPDLPDLIEFMARNQSALGEAIEGYWLVRVVNRIAHLRRANTRSGSRRNIEAHYDLGNDFYAAWLDAGMNYSSAIYTDNEQSLEQAQRAKLARVAALLALQGGELVLEIGCGWGALAEHLIAAHGCHVTGLTLSPAQLDHARARLAAHPQADLRLQDYRDVSGTFDRIVSIEMFEAVGEAYWNTYFSCLKRLLAPQGSAVLQVITIEDAKYDSYRRTPDFIQRHIFPGGMLPCPSVLREHIARAGLRLVYEETFGPSYARTLAEWRRRFHRAWPDLTRLGFDAKFRRKWDYYLAYCEGGFRARAIDVGLYRLLHA